MMRSKYLKRVTLFIAGACLTLSFAPFHLWFFSFISLTLLFYSWSDCAPLQGFIDGLCFGLGYFLSGVYWIYIAIHHYGNAPLPLSIILSGLLIATLSLFIAANGWLNALAFSKQHHWQKNLCIYPSTWVGFEWIRAHAIFNGFPWLLVGYSQTDTLLGGWAALIGVFGLSLLVCLISGGLSLWLTNRTKKQAAVALTAILIITSIGALLQHQKFTTQETKNQHVVLIQGNVEQSIKWVPSQLPITLKRYFNMTQNVKQKSLIVWPEGAVPTYPRMLPNFMAALKSLLQQTHSDLIFGTQFYSEKKNQFYNGMLLIGHRQVEYHKQHLVSFGEYYPLQSIAQPILTLLHMPPNGYSPGDPDQPPFIVNGMTVAPFICYEIAYPNLVLKQTKGKQILIVISDDSWFGDSIALEQQLQMTQMRAMETQRYVLACNNTGITAIISPSGKILVQAPKDKLTMLSRSITPTSGATPLMSWGFWPVWIVCILLLILGAWQLNDTHKPT